jgi:hypothetical protein
MPAMVAIIPNPHARQRNAKPVRRPHGVADQGRRTMNWITGRLADRPRSPLDRIGVAALVWTGVFLAAAVVLGYSLI